MIGRSSHPKMIRAVGVFVQHRGDFVINLFKFTCQIEFIIRQNQFFLHLAFNLTSILFSK